MSRPQPSKISRSVRFCYEEAAIYKLTSKPLLFFALAILALLLASCSVGAFPTVQAEQSEPEPAAGQVETVPSEPESPVAPEAGEAEPQPDILAPTDTVAPAATQTAAPTDPPPSQEPTEVVLPEPEPEVRTALAASDPESVQLASGRPQLVEFFAFW